MDAFFRKVNNLERQYDSSSNQQKSILASALINDEPVPNFPELASLSPRAKNNIALSLIGVAATNIREQEQAEFAQIGIVKFNGAPHPHILKDDGLRDKMIALGFADDARQESLGMQMVNAYLLRAFQN